MKIDFILTETSGFTHFYPLLQRGCQVQTRLGCGVQTFLTEDLGISPEYIENRIQTIFLDSRPVDDVEKTPVGDGAVLALSAAMPGLVGATMRRGGVLASFRNTITHRGGDACASDAVGFVILKLFNLLVGELGPGILERGVWVEADVLGELLKTQAETLETAFRRVELDGGGLPVAKLVESLDAEETKLVRLTVSQNG